MFELEYQHWDSESESYKNYWIEVDAFYPASQGNFFEPPTDNEWVFTVYDEQGQLTTDYDFGEVLDEIEGEWAKREYAKWEQIAEERKYG